jgi:putative DNA-invertase from lambdoid prophage Rac
MNSQRLPTQLMISEKVPGSDAHGKGPRVPVRDQIRERVKSGLAAAQARGVKLGRQPGQRPSDKKAKRVLDMHKEGLSYRLIGRNVGLSKNTVMEIVRRAQ